MLPVHGVAKSQMRLATEQVSRLIYKCKTNSSQVPLVVKKPAANAGDLRVAGSIPEWGRSPG